MCNKDDVSVSRSLDIFPILLSILFSLRYSFLYPNLHKNTHGKKGIKNNTYARDATPARVQREDGPHKEAKEFHGEYCEGYHGGSLFGCGAKETRPDDTFLSFVWSKTKSVGDRRKSCRSDAKPRGREVRSNERFFGECDG